MQHINGVINTTCIARLRYTHNEAEIHVTAINEEFDRVCLVTLMVYTFTQFYEPEILFLPIKMFLARSLSGYYSTEVESNSAVFSV